MLQARDLKNLLIVSLEDTQVSLTQATKPIWKNKVRFEYLLIRNLREYVSSTSKAVNLNYHIYVKHSYPQDIAYNNKIIHHSALISFLSLDFSKRKI
jgi:hypothetical protein